MAEHLGQVRLIGKVELSCDIGHAQIAFHQQLLGKLDALFQLPLQRGLSRRLLEYRAEPAFGQADRARHLGHAQPAIAACIKTHHQLVHLALGQAALARLVALGRNVEQAGDDAVGQAFRIDCRPRGLRDFIDQQLGQGLDGFDIFDFHRATQRRQRRRPAQRRREEPQQTILMHVQIEMRHPMGGPDIGPHGNAGGNKNRPCHRPVLLGKIATLVGNPDTVGHIIEENHDARIVCQIVTARARLAVGLPECAH